MSSDVVTILIFAAIAAVVLFQLYNVLGKRVGRQPEDDPKPAPRPAVGPVPLPEQAQPARPPRPEPDIEGVAALKAREPGFDPAKFVDGAKIAYEKIVKSFAAGDRSALQPLLAPGVYGSFEQAISAREAEGRSESRELPHPPRADLERVEVEGDSARARVRFLAELRSVLRGPEGETTDERRTAEIWTFERRIGDSDPNWRLARVEAAQA
ncbi:MAG TPA: TIM44-related membrane protein TimA [Caulobacteraceae bacterium]|nr:TIM44-related membrane protein TimA [Caulobacteraceae bacterium]